MYTYIYIYIERDREREREIDEGRWLPRRADGRCSVLLALGSVSMISIFEFSI